VSGGEGDSSALTPTDEVGPETAEASATPTDEPTAVAIVEATSTVAATDAPTQTPEAPDAAAESSAGDIEVPGTSGKETIDETAEPLAQATQATATDATQPEPSAPTDQPAEMAGTGNGGSQTGEDSESTPEKLPTTGLNGFAWGIIWVASGLVLLMLGFGISAAREGDLRRV
jgi:hypothetical protein